MFTIVTYVQYMYHTGDICHLWLTHVYQVSYMFTVLYMLHLIYMFKFVGLYMIFYPISLHIQLKY